MQESVNIYNEGSCLMACVQWSTLHWHEKLCVCSSRGWNLLFDGAGALEQVWDNANSPLQGSLQLTANTSLFMTVNQLSSWWCA